MIRLIVDSTTDLPQEYYEKYNIDMVSLVVNMEGKIFKDKVEISVDEVYEGLKNGLDIKTSLPSMEDVYQTIKKHAENNDDVIFITISQKLSGTFQSIHLVAEEIQEDYPNVKIKVIDSKGGAAIPGLMAIQAGKMIERDYSFEDIIETLKEMANHSVHLFTVNDLKYLFKSGRLRRASAMIGNLLRVKPILHVDDGEIKLLKKTRGQNKAINALIELTEEKMKDFPDQMIAVMHANDYDIALTVKEKLIDRLGDKEIIIDQIGSVLGTHIGISGIGIFFFTKKPKHYIK